MVDLSWSICALRCHQTWMEYSQLNEDFYLEIVDVPAMFDFHRAMGQMMIRNDGIYFWESRLPSGKLT